MKQLLKKRIAQVLTALLAVAMITCFIPQTAAKVYAESGGPLLELSTDVLGTNVNMDNAQTVYYGVNGGTPIAWRVIKYKTTGNAYIENQDGAMTLFAADNLTSGIQFADNDFNGYAESWLKSVVDGLYGSESGSGSLFTEQEQNAIQERTLSAGGYSDISPYSTDVSIIATDGYLWPLSTAEALALPSDTLRSASAAWWLRSPGSTGVYAAFVTASGSVNPSGQHITNPGGVRPAFDLDLSSVLFVSAATGGKSPGAGSLKPVSANSTGEWKLTVHDSSLDDISFSAADGADLSQEEGYGSWRVPVISNTGGAVPVPDDNEYVSAILADSNNNALYYGSIARSVSSASIDIPKGLAAGEYKLHIFREKINGDKFTDYASAFSTIDLTVTALPVETYTVTVNNGDGSGEYAEDAEVTITAAAPVTGMQFKEWTGDVDKVTFTEGSKTTSTAKFKMPAEALTFEAAYEAVPAPPEPIKVSIPTGKTLTYNGKSQTGVAAGTGYTLTGAAATNAGTYTAKAVLKTDANYTYEWSDGTTAARSISWKVNKATAKVTAPAGKTLTYNGKTQTGVTAGNNYTLTGTVKAANAGSYTAKAALKTNANYTYKWSDGTTAAKTVKWKINKATKKVTVPAGKTLTYNGKTQTGVAAGANYTLTGTVKAAKAGSYTAKAALKTNANYTYKWADGTVAAKTVRWKINKAANTFSIKARTATVKYSAVKKKAQTLGVTSVITFTNNGQGTRTYVKLSGNKKITVAGTTGQVTVQKKLKKGTYQVKVKVRANGNANYNASAWKTVTFTVRVK